MPDHAGEVPQAVRTVQHPPPQPDALLHPAAVCEYPHTCTAPEVAPLELGQDGWWDKPSTAVGRPTGFVGHCFVYLVAGPFPSKQQPYTPPAAFSLYDNLFFQRCQSCSKGRLPLGSISTDRHTHGQSQPNLLTASLNVPVFLSQSPSCRSFSLRLCSHRELH